jgi:enterochelin esterase-like enzyme
MVTKMAETAVAQMTVQVATINAPTPTPACSEHWGTLAQYQIESEALGEKLTYTIYLPACYTAKKAGGYPIIYLLHGQNMDDTSWPSMGVSDQADEKIRNGAPAFIMVFPYEVHNWDPISESKFGEAFINDLVPYIESHYDICEKRECQAIGGISRGGGWAMHIGLTNFEKFGAIGGHSMGYFPGDLYRVQNLLAEYTAPEFPRIYLDHGDLDGLGPSIQVYEQNLTATGVAHEYHVSDGSHVEFYWEGQMSNYLDWYIEGFNASK